MPAVVNCIVTRLGVSNVNRHHMLRAVSNGAWAKNSPASTVAVAIEVGVVLHVPIPKPPFPIAIEGALEQLSESVCAKVEMQQINKKNSVTNELFRLINI
jgi:hypothetical protein